MRRFLYSSMILFILLFPVKLFSQINNSVTINIAAGTYLNVKGDLYNNTGTIDNAGSIIMTGNYTNDGTFNSANNSYMNLQGAAQQIGGTNSTTFSNLVIEGTGNKQCNISTSIAQSLIFNSNKILIGNNDLRLLTGATISGADNNKFVVTNGNGFLKAQAIPTSADFLFPVGDATTSYKPITLNYSGTIDTFRVRIISGLHPTTGFDTYCVQTTYQLEELVSGGSNASLKLGWNISDEGSTFTRTDALMWQNISSVWTALAGTPGASANTPATDYSYQTSGITNLSSTAGLFSVISNCTASSDPVSISPSSDPICSGVSSTLTVSGGSLGTGAVWHWYAGSCGGTGTPVGTGTSIVVSPTVTTEYYVRAEGICGTSNCTNIKVTVTPDVITPVFALGGSSSICQGSAPITYNATATNNSGLSYSLDATSLAAGNSINSSTGEVTYAPSWNGSSTITATAQGCAGPKTNDHVVTIDPCTKTLNLTVLLEGYYHNSGMMYPAKKLSGGIFSEKWGVTITDTIGVELHDATNYATLIYKQNGVYLNTNGSATVSVPGNNYASYYITVKQRNHLDIVSSLPLSFASSSPVNYNFSNDITKAYGNNMKLLSTGIYGLFSGDITQNGISYEYPNTPEKDGMIDLDDVYYVFTSYLNGDLGYLISDLNGDGMVDINDVYLAYDNYLLGVYSNTP